MHVEIPLRPAGDEWNAAWSSLMRGDSWLARKTDRTRRLMEHCEYVQKWLPELSVAPKGYVIDVGPGMGETLEIARLMGHVGIGVDAPDGDGGMGDKYLWASRLMHQRQGLNVAYAGFLDWLCEENNSQLSRCCVAINFRGSVEQVFSRFMAGEPHDKHHQAAQMEWVWAGECESEARRMFAVMADLLRDDGVIVIHANGSRNVEEYNVRFKRYAEDSGLKLLDSVEPRLHKWGLK